MRTHFFVTIRNVHCSHRATGTMKCVTPVLPPGNYSAVVSLNGQQFSERSKLLTQIVTETEDPLMSAAEYSKPTIDAGPIICDAFRDRKDQLHVFPKSLYVTTMLVPLRGGTEMHVAGGCEFAKALDHAENIQSPIIVALRPEGTNAYVESVIARKKGQEKSRTAETGGSECTR